MDGNIVIGKIVKPQGIKGEVKIIPLTDDSSRFSSLSYLIIDGVRYGVKSCRVNSEAVFVLLENVCDRNAAELLRERYVEVERRDAVVLPEGRHFIVDLVGSIVYGRSADGDLEIGVLEEVLPYKTEVYRVRTNDGKYLLFPVCDGLVIETDTDSKKIVVDARRLGEVSCYED